MKRRILSMLLAAVMLLSLAACGSENAGGGTATADPLTKDDVISIAVISEASWPYNDNWKVMEYIREGVGATVEVTAIPASDASTKHSLMFANPEGLPDLVHFDVGHAGNHWAIQGAAVSFDSLAEYMPNLQKWIKSLSDEDYDKYITPRKAYDGDIYYSPAYGRQTTDGVRAWLYRKDIFDKHNLETPKTFDELYDVCLKLKELHPSSYPFGIRAGLGTTLLTMAPSFDEYWQFGVYYDYDEEKFRFGPTEDTMLEVIAFYKKMLAADLISPDFITINTNSWQELVATDRSFIMPEYQTRIDFFNSLARQSNPEFKLSAMVPPVANTEKGASKVSLCSLDNNGVIICNTGDERRIANAAKYLDWFYADENVELVSWGKEGETFEVVNGKKQYIVPEGTDEQIKSLYGFSMPTTFFRADVEAFEATESQDIQETRDMVLEHTMDRQNPVVPLSPEENKTAADINTEINTFKKEMITKLILGLEPMSKFDEFKETIEGMNIQTLLEIYETAYSRVKK